MLLFGRGRQEVLVNAVTLGWVWKVQCSYQVPLSCLWIGMYFEASQCLWGTDTPLCRSEGRRDARRAFLVQQTELWKVRRMMGGEGGWGENEWVHIIFQLFPRWHFIITTLGEKHCIAKAGGGRMALRMQPGRESSPSTCGSPSGGLGSRDQLNSCGCSILREELKCIPMISSFPLLQGWTLINMISSCQIGSLNFFCFLAGMRKRGMYVEKSPQDVSS